jgi:hypothetical protein
MTPVSPSIRKDPVVRLPSKADLPFNEGDLIPLIEDGLFLGSPPLSFASTDSHDKNRMLELDTDQRLSQTLSYSSRLRPPMFKLGVRIAGSTEESS